MAKHKEWAAAVAAGEIAGVIPELQVNYFQINTTNPCHLDIEQENPRR